MHMYYTQKYYSVYMKYYSIDSQYMHTVHSYVHTHVRMYAWTSLHSTEWSLRQATTHTYIPTYLSVTAKHVMALMTLTHTVHTCVRTYSIYMRTYIQYIHAYVHTVYTCVSIASMWKESHWNAKSIWLNSTTTIGSNSIHIRTYVRV
jgi:hypothetical protein